MVQLARKLGAGKIIGTVSADQKAALPLELGADVCITYDNFPDSVRNLTDGAGVDLILDSLAGNIMEDSFTCLAPYGRLVNYGNASGAAGGLKHQTSTQAAGLCLAIAWERLAKNAQKI